MLAFILLLEVSVACMLMFDTMPVFPGKYWRFVLVQTICIFQPFVQYTLVLNFRRQVCSASYLRFFSRGVSPVKQDMLFIQFFWLTQNFSIGSDIAFLLSAGTSVSALQNAVTVVNSVYPRFKYHSPSRGGSRSPLPLWSIPASLTDGLFASYLYPKPRLVLSVLVCACNLLICRALLNISTIRFFQEGPLHNWSCTERFPQCIGEWTFCSLYLGWKNKF